MKSKRDRLEIQTLSVFVVLSILTLVFVFGMRLVLFAPSSEAPGAVHSAVRPSLTGRGPAQSCIHRIKQANRSGKSLAEIEALLERFGIQDGPCQ